MTKIQEKLVLDNLRLAPYCVKRFTSRYRIPGVLGLDIDDLISEAFIALCRAAEMWDPQRGAFSTYAVVAIQNWLINVCKLDRVGIRNEVEMLSLDSPIGDAEEERLMDLLPDSGPQLEDTVINRRLASDLRVAVDELPDKDRRVITGLLHGHNPADLARAFGCSRQRIEQIQSRAYRRLRQRLATVMDPSADKSLPL
jgi:RNA polymerase sigma factor (sigma-70 family)